MRIKITGESTLPETRISHVAFPASQWARAYSKATLPSVPFLSHSLYHTLPFFSLSSFSINPPPGQTQHTAGAERLGPGTVTTTTARNPSLHQYHLPAATTTKKHLETSSHVYSRNKANKDHASPLGNPHRWHPNRRPVRLILHLQQAPLLFVVLFLIPTARPLTPRPRYTWSGQD